MASVVPRPCSMVRTPARRKAGSPSRSFSAIAAGPKSFKKGGKVKKTGIYKLHKGEKVVTAKQAKRPASKLRGRRI